MHINRRLLLAALSALPLGSAVGAISGIGSRPKYLVLVELKGANDGLNTLAPFESDAYRRLRPKLALSVKDVIKVGAGELVGSVGLHNAMAPLAPALGQDIAFIQGLGYPNQNRSHFKSIAIWETGGDGNQSNNRGWLTDSLERLYGSDHVSAHGASFEGSMGLFARGDGLYISMARINQLSGMSEVAAPTSKNKLMNLIVQQKVNLTVASNRLSEQLSRFQASSLPTKMPYGPLGSQLTDVLRIIGSETALPVMHVQHGSFDTHEGQRWKHPQLLRDLSENLAAFRKNLIAMGRWSDVLVMTYSEFGRRAAENGAEGTDHGTASIHVLMGGGVQAGLYGQYPSLTDLEDGDMKFTMDYRALYHQITSDWLGDSAAKWHAFADARLSNLIKQ
jgi:uncharacterized protein (DUF1501 family)